MKRVSTESVSFAHIIKLEEFFKLSNMNVISELLIP